MLQVIADAETQSVLYTSYLLLVEAASVHSVDSTCKVVGFFTQSFLRSVVEHTDVVVIVLLKGTEERILLNEGIIREVEIFLGGRNAFYYGTSRF